MDNDEFVDYKRERLQEISMIIKASELAIGGQTPDRDIEDPEIEELCQKIERLRNECSWLK